MTISRRTFMKVGAAVCASTLLPTQNLYATTLSSLPVTISTPGTYVLSNDISVSLQKYAAITITASDVTIDLNGYAISNTGVDSFTGAVGIYSYAGARTVVKNGTLRGFHTGVFVGFNHVCRPGHLIADVTIDECYSSGIYLSGMASVIKGCSVINLGRSSLLHFKGCASAVGICIASGRENMLIDNTVDVGDQGSSDSSVGILFGNQAMNSIAINNAISNADIGMLFTGSARCRETQMTSVVRAYFGDYVDLGGNI